MEAPEVHEEACALLLSGSNFFNESFDHLSMHKAAGLKQKLIKILMGTCMCAHLCVCIHICKYVLRKERM